MLKQNVVYAHSGIVFRYKKEGSTVTEGLESVTLKDTSDKRLCAYMKYTECRSP